MTIRKVLMSVHDEVICEVSKEDWYAESLRLLTEMLMYQKQGIPSSLLERGENMANTNPPEYYARLPNPPPPPSGAGRRYYRASEDRWVPVDLEALEKSNCELTRVNAELYDQNRRLREDNTRLVNKELAWKEKPKDPVIVERLRDELTVVKERLERQLLVEKNVACILDDLARFLGGLNLQDHPVSDQRKQRGFISALSGFLGKMR